MSYVFGADHTMLACVLHPLTAQAGEGSPWETSAQPGDDLGAVVVARGFAGG